jgi:DNA-binding transcriptional LysR family regulator
MIDLSLLRPMLAFSAVTEAGSFRGGADRLGLSPAYVSQLVSDLEARIGKQLLYRSTRRLALTEAGQAVLPHAVAMAEAFQAGLDSVRTSGTGLTGSLRLSLPTVLSNERFAHLVAQFSEANPALRLEVDLDDRPVNPVAAQVDLAIRVGDPGDDARLARRLFVTRGIVVTGPGGARALSVPADLASRIRLRSPAARDSLSLVRRKDGQRIEIAPQRQMVVNDAAMIRTLLSQTDGFALFPEFTVREAIAGGGLAHALPDWSVPDIPVTALYTERRTSLSNARAFVAAIEHDLRG